VRDRKKAIRIGATSHATVNASNALGGRHITT
jgi:hypothetical protein